MIRGAAKVILGVVMLGLLSACRSGWYAESKVTVRKVEDSDAFKVELAVYRYLLNLDFVKQPRFSAVFLKGSDLEVAAAIRQFPDHVPEIKPSDQVDLRPQSTPIDKRTLRPAVILSASATDPEGNAAQAVGSYYAGVMFRQNYFFRLKKSAGVWQIENVKPIDTPRESVLSPTSE